MKTKGNPQELNQKKNTVIFMMGAPGAGKSYVRKNLFSSTLCLDCDSIKETHPEYNPKNPSALHQWSSIEHSKQVKKHLFNPNGENLIIDGTGANSEKMAYQMDMAIKNGWTVALLYVSVSLSTSLTRNANRERVVPKEIVIDKYETVQTSFNIVAPYANNVYVIDNN